MFINFIGIYLMLNCNVLVVEKDKAMAEMLKSVLINAKFNATIVATVTEAESAFYNADYDLILLDWRLHSGAGIEWAIALKKHSRYKNIPIIFLISRGEEESIINNLNIGSDDYVTQPCSPKEVLARVRLGLYRQGKKQTAYRIKYGHLTLDTEERRFSIGDKNLAVGPTRFRMMEFFMTHPDKVFSREQLLDHIWGHKVYIEERTVDVHIVRLRQTLSEYGCGNLLQTVRGIGYRFSLAA